MRGPEAYSRDYLVHYYEIDRKRKLSLPALLHYFEDIATLNSEARGFTLDRYMKTGRMFLLLKWDVVVRFRPRFNETVRIETRPTAFRRFLANREYAVFGKDGTPLAEARSVWVYTDMESKRPVRVPDEICDGFGVPKDSAASFDPLEEPAGIDGEANALGIRVGPADLDNNGHVNNVRYVEWALWSMPPDFVRDHEVSGLKVHYRKELRSGDEAVLLTGIAERNGGALSSHSIRCGDSGICDLRMEWRRS
jgi:medium-chain acyl-[acyl-carrier-protein] hydrolase